MYRLEVVDNTIPDEYDNDTNATDIIFNLNFDRDGYIDGINVELSSFVWLLFKRYDTAISFMDMSSFFAFCDKIPQGLFIRRILSSSYIIFSFLSRPLRLLSLRIVFLSFVL